MARTAMWASMSAGLLQARALVARGPRLVMDETTAHVNAAPEIAEQLWTWFRQDRIPCTLRLRAGVAGLDVIDFGDPSPAEEKRIRKRFAAWYEKGQ